MKKIAVVGLGYVGLPLALEFGKHFNTVGFDISESKVESYQRHQDPTREVSPEAFALSTQFKATNVLADISDADVIVIAMPTPVDGGNNPDFTFLINASTMVGSVMKHGAIVVYESTVHPGATENICVGFLEKASGKKWKQDFFVGYSPERIRPGDKVMTLTKITKIVSGDTPETLETIASLYETIITAGVYRTSSIKVAEASKLVENIQIDVNVALVNELAMLFKDMGIDTNEVLDAAATKWNFSNYRPGLVGGHCISVDPHYLLDVAGEYGHQLDLIRTARRTNNHMASFILLEACDFLGTVNKKKIAILGTAFKENCSDIRNSKTMELIDLFDECGAEVFAWDPIVDWPSVLQEYKYQMVAFEDIPECDVVILAVPHREILDEGDAKLMSMLSPNGLFIDVKGKIDKSLFENNTRQLWRL